MKKTLKTLLSVLLCAALIFGVVCPATAAEEKVTPVILVHGIGVSELYNDPSGDAQPLSISPVTIMSALLRLTGYLVGTKSDPDEFITDAATVMGGFSFLSLDADGESDGKVGIINSWTDSLANHMDYISDGNVSELAICRTLCDKIGADNVYLYNYDWRLDACANAEGLADLVTAVKSQKGVDKVTIVGCSEGTMILSAYIDKYSERDDIERAVFLCGAMAGLSIANVYNFEFNTNVDDYMTYLEEFLKNFPINKPDLRSFLPIVPTLKPIIVNIARLMDKIMSDETKRAQFYNQVLYPIFGTIPIFWEFMPQQDLGAGMKKMLSIGFIKEGGGLYNKVVNYHGVQGRLKDNIAALREKGVVVDIISNYGMPSIPVAAAGKQCDGLIELKYSSLGAKVADYGMTLSAPGEKVSPDKVVNAAKGFLPDNTWYLRGVAHMQFYYGTEAIDFITGIMTDPEIVDVYTGEEKTGQGQFVISDRQQRISDETRTDQEDAETTGKVTVFAVLLRIVVSVGVTIGYIAAAYALA